MSDEEIRALKVKRANAKRSLTAYENFLKKFDNSKDFPILEKRSNDIERIREAFEEAQTGLESILEDSEELHNYRMEFEEQYYAAYGTANNLLQAQHANLISFSETVRGTTSSANRELSQPPVFNEDVETTNNEHNTNNQSTRHAVISTQNAQSGFRAQNYSSFNRS